MHIAAAVEHADMHGACTKPLPARAFQNYVGKLEGFVNTAAAPQHLGYNYYCLEYNYGGWINWIITMEATQKGGVLCCRTKT